MVTPSLIKLLYYTCSVIWSSIMLKNLAFIQVWYQIILQQMDVFGIIQITINFNQLSWSITFNVSLKHQTLSLKLHCFYRVMWVVSLYWRPSNKCSSILVSLLNMILFQVSASHSLYLFDQLNIVFKCFLVNNGFLVAMHPFSSCFQRMCLVVSTDIKLDKSHSSITCFAVCFFLAEL